MFATVLYLINLNKNAVVFQTEYNKIKFIDIDYGKLIYVLDFKEEEKIRNI